MALTRLSVIACAAVLGLGVSAAASTPAGPGAGQVVAAVPEPVFGFLVDASAATRSGSTIPVAVTRERVGDSTVITLAPRD